VIKTFGNKNTEKIWNAVYTKRFPKSLQETCRRKLRMINNAHDLNDLKVPPGNKLEQLVGELSSFHSIRVNRQWRLIFIWSNENAYEVELTDYH
jgi:proteic killer suppression protein